MADGLTYSPDSVRVAGAVALMRVLSPMPPDDGQVQHAAPLGYEQGQQPVGEVVEVGGFLEHGFYGRSTHHDQAVHMAGAVRVLPAAVGQTTGSVAHLVERSPGVFLLSVHVKDMAMLRLEFEGATLKRRVGNPNIHMVLEYAKSTGVVRTLVRGGAKYQQMLVEAFAEHVLGVKASAHKIKSPTLDLSMLRTGFDVPEVFEDGFSMVQLKALTLLSPDTALKIECTAMQSSQQRSVHDLLKEKLPGPLEGQWAVTAAQVNLYYPPEPGRTRPKVVTIEVTSKGRLNLHKFDAKMQAQLEGYLVAVGILQKGQTLSAQELPPETDAVSSSSAFED